MPTNTNATLNPNSDVLKQIREIVHTGLEAITYIQSKVRDREKNFDYILLDLKDLCLSVKGVMKQFNLFDENLEHQTAKIILQIETLSDILWDANDSDLDENVRSLLSSYSSWSEDIEGKIELPRRLHLGCGRNILDGWINLDISPMEGVDVVADLEQCKNNPLPFEDDSIDEFLASHVIEHINNTLDLMQELHRIAKPNAKAVFRVPYGSSDDAFEDPTHVKQYFINSFGYFSQPYYWRADYGYRGDWLTEKITLIVDKQRYSGKTADEIFFEINTYRNVVKEMIVELKAIKPIREPKRELIVKPHIEIVLQ